MRAAVPGLDGLGGRGELRPRAGSERVDRLRLPRGRARRTPARVQHGRDGARPAPRRRAVGAAAGPGQGGPRAHGRGARLRGVPARFASPGHRSRWRSGWSRSPCWRSGCRTRSGTGGFAEGVAPHSLGDAWRTLGEGWHNKGRTVLFLLLPTGLLALRSPMLLLVAVPTFAWRFLSARYTYWDPWYQYDVVLVPIAVAAMIEGAVLLHGRVRQIGLVAAARRHAGAAPAAVPRVQAGLGPRLLGHAGPDRRGRPGARQDPGRSPGGRLRRPRQPDRAAHRPVRRRRHHRPRRTALAALGLRRGRVDRARHRDRSGTRAGLARLRRAARERRVRGGRPGRRSHRRPPEWRGE